MHAITWTAAIGMVLGIAAYTEVAAALDGPAAIEPQAMVHPDGGPRRYSFLDAPPPAPRPFPSAPSREADEYARRNWEVLPSAGAGTPFCNGGGVDAWSCGQAGAGVAFALHALYRLSPYVALGAGAGLASFRLDGASAVGGYSRTSWLGVLVRGYFAERGSLDPYVEVGFGRGAAESGNADVRTASAGPSAMGGAGIDFWVLPYLRVGPALSYHWTWLSQVEVCQGGTCAQASLAEQGAVGSYATLSLVATIALGHEM